MRSLIPLLFARTLVAFLAFQVADTPIFCADEGPTEVSASADIHSAAPSSGLHASSGSLDGNSASCFCPCHMTFQSEAPHSLSSTPELASVDPLAYQGSPPAFPQALDHPPQNLG
jgi:hypothetical protein